MKRFFSTLLLSWLVLILGNQPAIAGDNPFSEKKVTIENSTDDTSTSELPEIEEGQQIEGTVDVDTVLNVRSAPWGDILGTVGNGDKLSIIEQAGDWYKIQYNGKIAYVHSAYVHRPGEETKAFPRNGWINAAVGANVRRVPQGNVIGKLKDQQNVEILGQVGDYYKIKYGDNEAFISKSCINTDQPSSPSSDQVVPMSFIGFVGAKIGLNVRTTPWGAIDTALPYGIAVKVTGKIGDWYQINYNGKVRYVHADYIVKNRNEISLEYSSSSSSSSSTSDGSENTTGGSSQTRVAQEAKKLVGSTQFRGAEVDHGNLACAQVASTALKRAGAVDKVVLNVRTLVSDLRAKGWKEVEVPPFKAGDVITWKTYDCDGDGQKDADTHVGVIVKEGNSYMAMNNSSRLRTPRLTDPYAIGPVSRVLRKAD